MTVNLPRLVDTITRHEGVRLTVYQCPAGKWTVGIGRNLEDKGITKEEADMLLENDLDECIKDLDSVFPEWSGQEITSRFYCNESRQEALVNMRFQLGGGTFRKFRKMITAIKISAKQALDSRWAKQTPSRASEIAEVLETGSWKR